MDSCSAGRRIANVTKPAVQRHSSYSPDLALSDFYFFQSLSRWVSFLELRTRLEANSLEQTPKTFIAEASKNFEEP